MWIRDYRVAHTRGVRHIERLLFRAISCALNVAWGGHPSDSEMNFGQNIVSMSDFIWLKSRNLVQGQMVVRFKNLQLKWDQMYIRTHFAKSYGYRRSVGIIDVIYYFVDGQSGGNFSNWPQAGFFFFGWKFVSDWKVEISGKSPRLLKPASQERYEKLVLGVAPERLILGAWKITSGLLT